MRPSPKSYLPLWLDLEGAPVLIVGAGRVALRRAATLIPCRPSLTVVAPEVLPGFTHWHSRGILKLIQRRYEASDLEDCRLVFACTDDPPLNRQIVTQASESGLWAEGCTSGSGGNMHPGSLVRRGALTIAISSSGSAPLLTRVLRECFNNLLGEEWERLAGEMAASRGKLPLADPVTVAALEARVRDEFRAMLQRYLTTPPSTDE